MNSTKPTSPKPVLRLFEEIFEDADASAIATVVADGVQALIANIDRLVSDVDCLVTQQRFASASFLLATAEEELAKVFILIDACRLDVTEHQSVQRRLCHAFYNHILKHAYNEVRRHPNINSMAEALDVWRLEVKRWWPGSPNPEDAEPALPHETFFDRETPLYVDWDYLAKRWVTPTHGTNVLKFDNKYRENDLERLRSELEDVKAAFSNGLLSATAFKVLNDVYASTYVKETTSNSVIKKREAKLVESLSGELGVSQREIITSPLVGWPLYHFTTLP